MTQPQRAFHRSRDCTWIVSGLSFFVRFPWLSIACLSVDMYNHCRLLNRMRDMSKASMTYWGRPSAKNTSSSSWRCGKSWSRIIHSLIHSLTQIHSSIHWTDFCAGLSSKSLGDKELCTSVYPKKGYKVVRSWLKDRVRAKKKKNFFSNVCVNPEFPPTKHYKSLCASNSKGFPLSGTHLEVCLGYNLSQQNANWPPTVCKA